MIVSESTLADLKELRDTLQGCPLDSRSDLIFMCSLDNVINYLQEQSNGQREVLSQD